MCKLAAIKNDPRLDSDAADAVMWSQLGEIKSAADDLGEVRRGRGENTRVCASGHWLGGDCLSPLNSVRCVTWLLPSVCMRDLSLNF
jgi:hypothetical protein